MWRPAETMASGSMETNLLQIVDGKVMNPQGETVYLDGLNYKDQFKWLLYERKDAPRWDSIESDITRMASLGVKAVRVWFNWIYYEPTPGKLDERRMLSDMQRIVDAAKKNGIYVIITIFVKHYWLNGKKINSWVQAHTIDAKTNPDDLGFWLNDGAFPAVQRRLFVRLWRTISLRFGSEPAVAAYNLINEPYNKFYDELPRWTRGISDKIDHYPLRILHEAVVREIRNNGDDHMIILDYNWVYSCGLVPMALPSTDRQLLYDVHMYYVAQENGIQGWDVTYKISAPWKGKSFTGERISYAYPESANGHDRLALESRFETLAQAQLGGYVFYFGEFGLTENIAYNTDVASLIAKFDFTGFAYFEYCPDSDGGPGSVEICQSVMAYARN